MTEAEHRRVMAWLCAFCSARPPVHTLTAMILLTLYPRGVKTMREIARLFNGSKGALRIHIHRLTRNGVVRCDTRVVGGNPVGFYSLTKSGIVCVEGWIRRMESFYGDATTDANS